MNERMTGNLNGESSMQTPTSSRVAGTVAAFILASIVNVTIAFLFTKKLAEQAYARMTNTFGALMWPYSLFISALQHIYWWMWDTVETVQVKKAKFAVESASGSRVELAALGHTASGQPEVAANEQVNEDLPMNLQRQQQQQQQEQPEPQQSEQPQQQEKEQEQQQQEKNQQPPGPSMTPPPEEGDILDQPKNQQLQQQQRQLKPKPELEPENEAEQRPANQANQPLSGAQLEKCLRTIKVAKYRKRQLPSTKMQIILIWLKLTIWTIQSPYLITKLILKMYWVCFKTVIEMTRNTIRFGVKFRYNILQIAATSVKLYFAIFNQLIWEGFGAMFVVLKLFSRLNCFKKSYAIPMETTTTEVIGPKEPEVPTEAVASLAAAPEASSTSSGQRKPTDVSEDSFADKSLGAQGVVKQGELNESLDVVEGQELLEQSHEEKEEFRFTQSLRSTRSIISVEATELVASIATNGEDDDDDDDDDDDGNDEDDDDDEDDNRKRTMMRMDTMALSDSSATALNGSVSNGHEGYRKDPLDEVSDTESGSLTSNVQSPQLWKGAGLPEPELEELDYTSGGSAAHNGVNGGDSARPEWEGHRRPEALGKKRRHRNRKRNYN